MAKHLLLLLITLLLAVNLGTSVATNLVTYWGQNSFEGNLSDACQSNLYNIIIISFLTVFGNNQQPVLNLAGHCDPTSGTCTWLTSHIQSCQSQGIKVLLSIGGGAGNYDLISDNDARSVSTYLWDNYLGGQSNSRPLGPAVLDGIDFAILNGSSNSKYYYGKLAQSLLNLSSTRAIITAAPQCPFPDSFLGPALETGLFHYVWVQFYNNPPCQYSSGNNSLVLSSWGIWTSSLKGAQVLLGLPAATNAAPAGGFIPPDVLISEVLPQIKETNGYGGVMLWSYYFDRISGYGASIKPSLAGIEKSVSVL